MRILKVWELGYDIAGEGFFPLWKQTKNDFCGRRRQTEEKPARSGSVKGERVECACAARIKSSDASGRNFSGSG